MKALVVLMGLGLLGPASSVFADSPDILVPGVRVRPTIATAPGAPLKGTIQSADDAILTVIVDDSHIARVAREHVKRLEISRGREGNARKGLMIGGLLGVSMGAVYLAAGTDESPFCTLPPCASATTGEKVGAVGLVTLVYGGIGALIGRLVKSERWMEAPLNQPRVRVVPTRGRGIGINVSFAF